MDKWLALIRESAVPSLKEQNGFPGFVALVGRQHDKSIGYSIWAGFCPPFIDFDQPVPASDTVWDWTRDQARSGCTR